MSFILKGSHIWRSLVEGLVRVQDVVLRIWWWKRNAKKIVLNWVHVNYMGHGFSIIIVWRMKNRPFDSTFWGDDDGPYICVVLVVGGLYRGLQVTSSVFDSGLRLGGFLGGRGMFWRAESRLKGIDGLQSWTLHVSESESNECHGNKLLGPRSRWLFLMSIVGFTKLLNPSSCLTAWTWFVMLVSTIISLGPEAFTFWCEVARS